jgi:hypothetical protein
MSYLTVEASFICQYGSAARVLARVSCKSLNGAREGRASGRWKVSYVFGLTACMERSMIVGAHQPHCLPWLGYLDKIARSDLFVVMDDLQYEAQNFQNRNRIKVNNGTAWITVPLVKGSQSDRICDKQIQNLASAKEHWQRRGWLTLSTHYRKSPFFSNYSADLEEAFSRPWTMLLDFSLHMLQLHLRWFEIDTPIVLASTLALRGQKTDRIIDMCSRVGATTYFSGRGGSTSYLDLPALENAGVELMWQHFNHPIYEQRYPELGFIKNLSALDLLFNCGPQSAALLREQSDSPPASEPEPLVSAGAA